MPAGLGGNRGVGAPADGFGAADEPGGRVSVIIPARDERGRIGRAIREVRSAFSGSPFELELIVVDDGSRDGTAREARATSGADRVLSLPQAQGKGGALAAGFAASRGEFVGFIDADLEYPPALLPRMAAALAVQGHRACAVGVRAGDVRSPTERLTSRLARLLVRSLLGLGVQDTQAGVKMFPGGFARSLAKGCDHGWLFDIDALLRAAMYGLAILEFPLIQQSSRRRRAGLAAMVACLPAFLRLAAGRWRFAFGTGEMSRIMRYAMVGGINTAIDFAIFSALTIWHPPGRTAWLGGLYAGVGWAVASVVGYYLHSNVTFRAKLSVTGFYLVTVAGIAVQSAAGASGAALGGTPGTFVGKLVGIPLGAAVTYYGYRLLADRTGQVGKVDADGAVYPLGQ